MNALNKNILFESKRLLFRQFVEGDALSLFQLNSDPKVVQYTGDGPFKDQEESKRFLKNYSHYASHGYGRWAVLLKSNHEFIGWSGLKYHDEGYVDLGYRFFQKHWAKGYATESAFACLEYGFNHLDLNEIVGRVARQNIASIKVLEKTGMVFWKEAACEGILDSLYYKVDKSKFNQLLASLA